MTENVKHDCVYHIDHENRIHKNEEDIKEIDNRLTENEKTVAIFDVELRNAVKDIAKYMERQTIVVEDIKKGTDKNTDEIKELSNKISARERDCDELKDLKTRIDTIDNESKVNTRTWLRDNYLKVAGVVVFGTLLLSAIATYIISKVI